MLKLVPMSFRDACAYITEHHRHHVAPQGYKFAVGVFGVSDLTVHGVVMVGRPVARKSDDGFTAEITRLCTDGTSNAASMLYGAACRAAIAMGYTKIITFTLDSEPGTSLLAANFKLAGTSPGRSWSVPSRPRTDKSALGARKLWVFPAWKAV